MSRKRQRNLRKSNRVNEISEQAEVKTKSRADYYTELNKIISLSLATMTIALPVYKFEELEKKKSNRNLTAKENRDINLKTEINNIPKKDLQIEKEIVAKMKVEKISIGQRTIGRSLKQIIDVRFNEIEAVKLVKKRLHLLNNRYIDYNIQDFVHTQLLDQYQFLESIA